MTIPTPTPPRPLAHTSGLYYSFEKAGLTLDRQPIPWNAEAVLVEAIVNAVTLSAERLREYALILPGGSRVLAETSRPGLPGVTHIFFRLAVPPTTMPAEIRDRERTLGQINLPVLTQADFLKNLTFAEPTVHVRMKDGAHACQAYVAVQAKEVIASMLLSSPTSLAPLADLELGANVVARDELVDRRVVRLGSKQLAAKQALIVVPFAKPRWAADWQVAWTVGDEVRATQTIHAYRPSEFIPSLRLSTTRLYLEGPAGVLPLARFSPPTLAGITRLGPVFLVSSGITGIAATADFQVIVRDRSRRPLMDMPTVTALVSDGPTVIAPGTLAADESIGSFELWSGRRRLGELPLGAPPTAAFNAEGGIATPQVDFAWSPQAEEQLQQKLGQLLGGL